jgi:predicted TPR repeat methyltransferase
MKVMVLVKATSDSEAGVMPTEEILTAMGQFNEELVGRHLDIVHLGCGDDVFGQEALLQGARSYTGIEISETMSAPGLGR